MTDDQFDCHAKVYGKTLIVIPISQKAKDVIRESPFIVAPDGSVKIHLFDRQSAATHFASDTFLGSKGLTYQII